MPQNSAIPLNSHETEARRRLLDSAEKFFARRGFEATSVRDITTAAKCNLAAVNYHFGSKENLYREVFSKHLDVLREVRIKAVRRIMAEKGPDLTLEELLDAFAVAFLDPILDRNGGRTLVRLMMREMSNPRLPATLFSREVMLPVQQVLRQAILRICPTLEPTLAQQCIHSLIGQLIHFMMLHDYFSRTKELDLPVINLNDMVGHVVAFTANGIRAYCRPIDTEPKED